MYYSVISTLDLPIPVFYSYHCCPEDGANASAVSVITILARGNTDNSCYCAACVNLTSILHVSLYTHHSNKL